MYAVVKSGGKQYKVVVNDVLRVETLPGVKGDTVDLSQVLLVGDDSGIKTGAEVAGSKVTARIVQQVRSKKVLVFKRRRRKNYRRMQGHRQNLTELRITGIQP
ncbi:MAG: 50S ribosomal protein L21 [Magnetococcales bacterium]|nr:50S ribosomal protein L21 [Magnetococcales bacterium]